jgi:hypothetical protein
MLRPHLEHDAQARGWAPAATATIAAFWTEADAGENREGAPSGLARARRTRAGTDGSRRSGIIAWVSSLLRYRDPWPARAE